MKTIWVSAATFLLTCGCQFQSSIHTPLPAGATAFQVYAAAQSINLGASSSIPLAVTAASGFTGTVSLVLDTTDLSAVDPNHTVTVGLSQNQLSLIPGQVGQAMLNFNVSTMAPSINSQINVTVTEEGQARPHVSTVTVPVTVVPIYDIFMMGGPAPEQWSAPPSVNFAQHTEGVIIRFTNLDTNATHQLASTLQIPAAETTLAMATAGGPGGTVSVTVNEQTPMTFTYYCMTHETAAEAKSLNFNVVAAPAPSPSPSPTANPNATFTYINTQILQPRCVSCHGNSGGVSFNSYAQTLLTVVPGNPAASEFYTSVQSGVMPLGGSPLNATQIQAISDWITYGALNN